MEAVENYFFQVVGALDESGMFGQCQYTKI